MHEKDARIFFLKRSGPLILHRKKVKAVMTFEISHSIRLLILGSVAVQI